MNVCVSTVCVFVCECVGKGYSSQEFVMMRRDTGEQQFLLLLTTSASLENGYRKGFHAHGFCGEKYTCITLCLEHHTFLPFLENPQLKIYEIHRGLGRKLHNLLYRIPV